LAPMNGGGMPESRKTFDDQLGDVRGEVVKLAARACEQIGAATQALLDADLSLVDRVDEAYNQIEQRVVQIEHQVYQLFALQQPMASDLRTMLVVLRILHEIELTGGLMRNVARATRRLYPRELPPRIRGIIERMGAQASVQTHLAVDAFADNDEAIASALPDMDDVMDDLQKELFRAVFAGFAGESTDEAVLQMAVQLAFVGRDYERAADHAVMIGRWVEFMITGQLPGDAGLV
ncbi:MAG: phosphate signaling complex protein PhoU, partial [Actinomycetota bacterium]